MKILMLITAGIFIVLVLVILTLLIMGLLQPVKHSVTRSIHLHQPPATVFAVLTNTAALPTWSTTVQTVEPLPDSDGKPTFRVTMKWGHLQMLMTQLKTVAPTQLVIRMARENGPILGTWTYQLTADNNGGCNIALTEEGELKNPFLRAIAWLRGSDTNIKQTLRDLAQKIHQKYDRSTGVIFIRGNCGRVSNANTPKFITARAGSCKRFAMKMGLSPHLQNLAMAPKYWRNANN